MKINGFTPNSDIFLDANKSKNTKTSAESFSDFIKEKLESINDKQIRADETTDSFIKGNEKNIHNVMLATQEARMSLDMAIEVRNKMVEAYQEINRMQI
ncbi:flagellar hook-basal body complex protein FliE [Haloimpatiens sp. FM7315]|uniref:flagellar hook-basal body complex protein FliE n=1 Tax=Haloimpatiens sp. FM7315 TaxID=3298609 RepID=UPI0035A37EBC